MAISTLQWNRVSDCEWQAGGGANYYSIMESFDNNAVRYEAAHFSEGKITRLGWSLDFAMARTYANDHHRHS